MEVKVKKLVPEAVLPKRAHASDAGFDLVAVFKYTTSSQMLYFTSIITLRIALARIMPT